MQKKFRRLAAAILCLTLLAVPALAAEATIDLDYVTIVERASSPTPSAAWTRCIMRQARRCSAMS